MECPACGCLQRHVLFTASDRLYRTTRLEFAIVECTQCRLMRLSPQPSPEELGTYYPPNYWYAPERGTASRL
ncbi:MAG: hypothetical protein ABIZ80_07485, partial [Bryobacteraceae bacterium]